MMGYRVIVNNDIIVAWILGKLENDESAPEGFTPENSMDWVKVEGEWELNPELAQQKREELQEEE